MSRIRAKNLPNNSILIATGNIYRKQGNKRWKIECFFRQGDDFMSEDINISYIPNLRIGREYRNGVMGENQAKNQAELIIDSIMDVETVDYDTIVKNGTLKEKNFYNLIACQKLYRLQLEKNKFLFIPVYELYRSLFLFSNLNCRLIVNPAEIDLLCFNLEDKIGSNFLTYTNRMNYRYFLKSESIGLLSWVLTHPDVAKEFKSILSLNRINNDFNRNIQYVEFEKLNLDLQHTRIIFNYWHTNKNLFLTEIIKIDNLPILKNFSISHVNHKSSSINKSKSKKVIKNKVKKSSSVNVVDIKNNNTCIKPAYSEIIAEDACQYSFSDGFVIERIPCDEDFNELTNKKDRTFIEEVEVTEEPTEKSLENISKNKEGKEQIDLISAVEAPKSSTKKFQKFIALVSFLKKRGFSVKHKVNTHSEFNESGIGILHNSPKFICICEVKMEKYRTILVEAEFPDNESLSTLVIKDYYMVNKDEITNLKTHIINDFIRNSCKWNIALYKQSKFYKLGQVDIKNVGHPKKMLDDTVIINFYAWARRLMR